MALHLMNHTISLCIIAVFTGATTGCQLQGTLFGSKTTPSSQTGAPMSASTDPGGRAAPSTAPMTAGTTGSVRLVGTVEQGALIYKDGRLYFGAWAAATTGEVPRKLTPPTATLLEGSRVLGTSNLRRHHSWDEAFLCAGAIPSSADDGSISLYSDDCSFPAELAAREYTLRLQHGATTLDQITFRLVASRDVAGNKQLIVAPSARENHAFLESGRVTYWHRVDPRDPVESLQFVWLRGNTVDSAGAAIAKGQPLWHADTPLVDVLPVKGATPKTPWGTDSASLRLLVFRDGEQLVSSLRVGRVMLALNEHGKLATLVPATDVTKAQIATARAAAQEQDRWNAQAQYIDLTWSEQTVCAVFEKQAAKDALGELFSGRNQGRWAEGDAQQAAEDSEQKWRTEKERRELKEKSARHKTGAAAATREAKGGEAKLAALERKYARGCMAKLTALK